MLGYARRAELFPKKSGICGEPHIMSKAGLTIKGGEGKPRKGANDAKKRTGQCQTEKTGTAEKTEQGKPTGKTGTVTTSIARIG